MTDFKVYSDFNPMGDQPEAIGIPKLVPSVLVPRLTERW